MTSKPATLKDIALKLNLSISTVSRALHDHPSIGLTTRQRVKKMAEEIHYEPNQAAVFFQQGKTNTLGVILPELSEAFFSSAISAIEEVAYQNDYTVLIGQSHDREEKEKELVEKMKNHRVDGLLVSLAKNTVNFDHFEKLKKYDIPVVFFDRIPPHADVHSVSCNMETGTMEAVTFLLKKGHRTIGMINGPETLFASRERKEGYIKALQKNRFKFDPSLIVTCDLSEGSTRDCLTELLSHRRKVTAIVAFNDYIALFALKCLRSMPLPSGENPELVSFANLPMIHYMDHVPVASVEQFPFIQGQKAADILIGLLNKQLRHQNNGQPIYNQVVIASKLIEHIKN